MSVRQMNVLAVDDCDADAALLERALQRLDNLDIRYRACPDAHSAIEALQDSPVDLIFLDYQLGGETGIDLLRRLRVMDEIGPIIMLTGVERGSLVAEMLREGADDYVSKNDLSADTLRRVIETAMAKHHRRLAERRNAELLTWLREAKESLEEKNARLASLFRTAREFVDDVAHEFRTPLSVIKEFTCIMRDGLAGPTTPEQRGYLEIVAGRVEALAGIVDDMLDTGRIEAGLIGSRARPCRIGAALRQLQPTIAVRAGVRNPVIYDMPPNLPQAFCDCEKIGRVVINLVGNALKFSPEGAPVRISVRHDGQEGRIVVSVVDEGPGIAPDDLKQLFQRFRQLNQGYRSGAKGFGLGLNIVRELVHLNLGQVDVESTVGKGSTFRFWVPVAEPEALLRHYLARAESFRGEARYISLLALGTDASAGCEALDDVWRLLVRSKRRHDLLAPKSRAEWILLAATDTPDCDSLAQRLRSIHEKSDGGMAPPPITARHIGTWQRNAEADAIRQAFVAAIGDAMLDPCGCGPNASGA